MNLQRKATLLVATGAVALGAGHMVQKRAADRLASAEQQVVVVDVTPVAAGPETVQIPAPAPVVELPPVPVAVVDTVPAVAVEPATPETAPSVVAAVAPEQIEPVAPPPVTAAVEPPPQDCTVQFDLLPQPGAMIGLTLLAPCHGNERVVLHHAGLTVTAKTSESGTLFGSLPALSTAVEVDVRFGSGDRAITSIDMPEAEGVRRFAVQWQGGDAFQLHAFEGDAGYDEPGHFSAIHSGKPGEGAFVTLLGDSTTELPLMAEVFTFAPGQDAEVVLEAAVSAATCGREILGETLMAEDGKIEVADLTLAMPACDAIGDILVLKNLVQDMKLAAAK
ncbi:hypothetical protein ACSBLW_13545 [Thioclava sp. FR2]|uniref:hypothetical protein n=1 Tax=Thioclava sp. FR2 TaxID=3445780 RepID=UPI003EB89527